MSRPISFSGATYSAINPEMPKAERDRARRKTANAIKRGDLVRPTHCEACGGSGRYPIHAHHPDYRKPFEVMWLCRPCHWIEHNRVSREAKFGYYSRDDVREYALARREASDENRERNRAAHRARWAAMRPYKRPNRAKPGSLALAKRMAADGATLTAIAKEIGLTLSGAHRFLKRNGIERSATLKDAA